MEDLEWKLLLKESEVAHAYREVDEVQNGNSRQARAKLERLLRDEAALAKAVLELDLAKTGAPS